jgi:hypothetical protein
MTPVWIFLGAWFGAGLVNAVRAKRREGEKTIRKSEIISLGLVVLMGFVGAAISALYALKDWDENHGHEIVLDWRDKKK